MAARWETYEQVSAYLLNLFAHEFGVDFFEGKQNVEGKESGTNWEIDAKGVKNDTGGFMIVECKHWDKAKVPQGIIGHLAYSIIDAGAIGGIIVSPLGVQEGGHKVAAARNIFEVRLDAHSTRRDFVMHFLDKFMVGAQATMFVQGAVSVEVERADTEPS